jgi:hypothetical protein
LSRSAAHSSFNAAFSCACRAARTLRIALESRAVVVGGLDVTPDVVVDANVRRLQRLARHELAAGLPDGRWQVPPDLVGAPPWG